VLEVLELTEIQRRMKDELQEIFGHYEIVYKDKLFRNYTSLKNTKRTIGFEIDHNNEVVYFAEVTVTED